MFLAIGQLVTLLVGSVQRATGRAGIRTVYAGQAALCQVDTLATVVEQLERNVRVVLTTWVLRQVQLDDVTTDRIDSQFQDIGLDPDQVLADRNRRQFGSAGFRRWRLARSALAPALPAGTPSGKTRGQRCWQQYSESAGQPGRSPGST
ncbi:hypothetical protein PPS11_36110 [Pseudomonas putida S11]|nr:hypothetical protein PPS11_36110 [Pseudomonas putida S11]